MVRSDRIYMLFNRLDEIMSSGPAPRGSETAAEGKYEGDEGDWMVMSLRAEPATLNPVTRRDVYGDWVTRRNVFEPLLDFNYDDLRLEPILAESWDVSDDGLEVTFHLRGDIYFSDGVPVTADDVIFTYNAIIDPNVDAAQLANYYIDVDRAVKIDDRTVKFIMKKPYYKILEYIGLTDAGVVPKHIYQYDDPVEFNKRRSEPVGSGPYVFEKWDVGSQIVFRRNENYWGKKPKLKKLVFRIITNDMAALQAFRVGQVDFVEPIQEQFAELNADPEFAKNHYCLSFYNPKIPYFYIGWNQDKPFFKDRRIRLALTLMIDRQEIITHLLKDQGAPTSGPFYIYSRQSDPNVKPWPHDPTRAAQLLEEAGWVDSDGDGVRDKGGVPFRFKMMTPSENIVAERICKFVKDETAALGIEVIPDPFEWSIFLERLMDREFDAEISGWGGVVEEDPFQIWHSSQITGRASNRVGFDNPEADALIEEARKTFDEDKRNALYHKLHRIIHEEQPFTFLYARPELRFLDKRFKNVKIHSLGLDWLEWYVPAAEQKYR
jgi:peptide/nickel transport system substrate-binding protein